MLDLQSAGAVVFDYGNNLRQRAFDAGVSDRRSSYPGFVPAYIRPLFCEGKGPFRWVALSGDPQDIYATDQAILELFPENEHLARWIRMAQEKVEFQGLPARICWLGYGERGRAGLRFNELVRQRPGQGAHRHRPRPPGQRLGGQPQPRDGGDADGSDAIADWPLLNALINAVRRRDLGEHPPRRRRGHRLQHPRRPGHRRRRHAGGGAPPGARADQRPRHGRSSATPTPAIRRRSPLPGEQGVKIPMLGRSNLGSITR